MKKRRWMIGIFLAMLVVGIITKKVIQGRVDREQLKHALNLERLPAGTRIIGSAEDIWTDYVVHFVVRLEEGTIGELLGGWNFTASNSYRKFPYQIDHSGYTSHLPNFDVHHLYLVDGVFKGISVETNQDESMAYILYMAD